MSKQIHHLIKSINKLPHETDVNTKTSMNSRAINAEKDPICNWRPCWILRIAIETTLKQKASQLQKSNTRTHSIADLNPISWKIQNSKWNKTNLVFGFGFEFSENGVLVGEAIRGHWNSIKWKIENENEAENGIFYFFFRLGEFEFLNLCRVLNLIWISGGALG